VGSISEWGGDWNGDKIGEIKLIEKAIQLLLLGGESAAQRSAHQRRLNFLIPH
jgi:hypothetical protein